ncbi:MAG: hypothetical protein ACUVX9_17885, partial [Anaerolineae bacterium]
GEGPAAEPLAATEAPAVAAAPAEPTVAALAAPLVEQDEMDAPGVLVTDQAPALESESLSVTVVRYLMGWPWMWLIAVSAVLLLCALGSLIWVELRRGRWP